MRTSRTLVAISSFVVIGLATSSALAQGWTDKLDGMTQLAKAAHAAGNVDGAKSVIIAGLPTFLSIMQQNAMHIPRNRKSAEDFNAAAELIYTGHPAGADSAAFQKVLATFGPTLIEQAEVMARPNGSARNQLAMLLQAKTQQEEIRARLIAYVQVAPNPGAHMKEPGAKDVIRAIETIIIGITEMAPRTESVMKEATAKGEEVLGWAEGALSKDDLFRAMANSRRAAEIGEGLVAIDPASEAGKTISTRALAVQDGVAKAYAKQVAKNRLPTSEYKGADGAALGSKLLALYKKTYPKEKPLKVVVVSPDWQVEVRADWSASRKSWTFTRYKMLSEVAVSVAREDGKTLHYWVNFMRAYQVWNGKSYGPTQITPIGGWMPYEVLAAHAR